MLLKKYGIKGALERVNRELNGEDSATFLLTCLNLLSPQLFTNPVFIALLSSAIQKEENKEFIERVCDDYLRKANIDPDNLEEVI